MKNLLDFQTPTGQRGNVLNPMTWLSFILGTVFLLATFSIGQNVAKKVSNKLPAIDTQPEPIFNAPVSNNVPRKEYYGG